MATATVNTTTRTLTTFDSVTLTISIEEAMLIRTVLGRCNSNDKNVQTIYDALYEVGFNRFDRSSLPTIDLLSHPIDYTLDEPKA